jgi:hypothetical protein
MTLRISAGWRMLLPVVTLVVASCGGSPSVTGGSPIAAASSPAGNEPAPPSGSFNPGPIPLDLSTGAIVAVAAREDADRANERALADMAGYLGPDSPALAAALDKQAADGLSKQVDAATAASTTSNAVLASVRLPRVPGEVAAGAAPPPGMSLMGPWAASMIIVDSPSSWDRAYSDSHHTDGEIVLGANKGTIKTDTTTTVTPSGSRLVVDVQLKQVGEVNDANGRLVFRINGTGHAHVDIQGCPDTQGVAQASMEFSSSDRDARTGWRRAVGRWDVQRAQRHQGRGQRRVPRGRAVHWDRCLGEGRREILAVRQVHRRRRRSRRRGRGRELDDERDGQGPRQVRGQ